MPPNDTAFTWTTVLSTCGLLSTVAGVLFSKVASSDYEQLAESIKASALLLYPDTSTTVCTFRTKPTWFKCSKKSLWTATLTRNADELVLKKVHGRSSREAALSALDGEVKRTLKENREQMDVEADYALGGEFGERNERNEGDAGSEDGLCYGYWRPRDGRLSEDTSRDLTRD